LCQDESAVESCLHCEISDVVQEHVEEAIEDEENASHRAGQAQHLRTEQWTAEAVNGAVSITSGDGAARSTTGAEISLGKELVAL
jgi:hypothetical protein